MEVTHSLEYFADFIPELFFETLMASSSTSSSVTGLCGGCSWDFYSVIAKFYGDCGSTIVSDKWRSYNSLSEHGYVHNSINHKENFVDPSDPLIHTQNIERCWRDLKEWISRQLSSDSE